MIKKYPNGEAFIKDNKEFLDKDKYMSSFFYLDAPLLKEPNKKNYALKAYQDNKQLLAMKVEPYYFMLYGEKDLFEELINYVKDNDLEINGFYAPMYFGEDILSLCKQILGKEFHLLIGMDFMEANEITEPSSNEIEKPTEKDAEELLECYINFVKDCGLSDETTMEHVLKRLPDLRVLRRDGKIVSFCGKSPDSENSLRISAVYTRPEYRGKGLARKVVNYVKNEILDEGKVATLNVDKANPVSNHLYSSLGFKKVHSSGIYLPK